MRHSYGLDGGGNNVVERVLGGGIVVRVLGGVWFSVADTRESAGE